MEKLKIANRRHGPEDVRHRNWQSATVFGSLFLAFSLVLALFPNDSYAMRNPAAVYCTALGYNYIIETTAEGERGLCQLPNGEKVDAWQFLQGEVAAEYSYCHKLGHELKVVHDKNVCWQFMTDSCAVCVREDGSEVEVTELMELTFEETTCGDGTCGMPEDYGTCPEDCPSGSMDAYCDEINDGICDPDCELEEDPDCEILPPEESVLEVNRINPVSCSQGEKLEVTITGIYFTENAMVDFGDGITVDSISVSDSTQITAGITISSNAEIGTRDVSVIIPDETDTLEDCFTVHKAGEADGVPWVIIIGVIGGVFVVATILFLLRKRPQQRSETS